MVFTTKSPPVGPVVLKVVPVTGVFFSDFTMDQIDHSLMCASLFLHPLTVLLV